MPFEIWLHCWGGVQQVADKLANKGNTYYAIEEDYKKDLDVIEKRTQVLIKAGEKETEAKKKARKEQLDLLNMTLLQENKALAKAKEDYENAYANSIDDSASKYIRENAKSVLKTLAIEYSTYQSSVNVFEARRKRLGSDIKPEGNTGSGVSSLSDKEKRELEKAARERQKLQEQIQESELSLMDEGLNKELAKISLGYNKKIAAIKGGSKEEIAARDALGKEMQEKLDEYAIKYNSDREKKDVDNAHSVVKKGSKEELDLKLRQLDLQREAEITAAEKTGEDVFLIDEKYAKKKQELYEKRASDQVLLIAENAAHEQSIRDEEYIMDTLALKKQLASKEITQQEYAEREYQLKLDYARKTTEAAIDALEMQLNAEKNLGPDERAKLAEQLQKAKADLARQEAEAEIEAIEKIEKADEKSKNKRIKNVEKWLQVASQAVGVIGDLVSTVYDGQIEKIEKEQDANDEKYDKDIERIENLAETGAITEEEAEARKRAAKIQTEAKNKELERQKQEIAYKQAIWNKGTQVAETGIATARGIMEAFKLGPIAGAIMAAVVGAMGAIQVATILATPIPSYAEGTKDTAGHRGGTALVGDAGKQEVVMYKGQAWITPDTPTLVDIPKGAQVFPDVDEFDLSNLDLSDLCSSTFSPSNISSAKNNTIVVNDYSRLERRIDTTNNLLLKSIKQQREDANNRDFENYKRWKLS
jgi:hypothetical protein|nr:MAG TPA: tail tape measure protein [Caudoviricetes sp.]